jgi:hypothetical protein
MYQDTLQKLFDMHAELIKHTATALRLAVDRVEALEKRLNAVEDKQRSAPSWQDLRSDGR